MPPQGAEGNQVVDLGELSNFLWELYFDLPANLDSLNMSVLSTTVGTGRGGCCRIQFPVKFLPVRPLMELGVTTSFLVEFCLKGW